MSQVTLHIGGLVAVGFDSTGRYLLTVSHSGRGVFDAATWECVARDDAPAYPLDGVAIGIGPIEGEPIRVNEINYDTGTLQWVSPQRDVALSYESGVLTIDPIDG